MSNEVLETMAARRSVSSVEEPAPDDAQLTTVLRSVTGVADHKGLRPWRLILLRGDDRVRLGHAFDVADGKAHDGKGHDGKGHGKGHGKGRAEALDPGKVNPKPMRAPLLIAIVASPGKHPSVPRWEQEAVASGVAHLLSLALWSEGWGVMWRSGEKTDAEAVRELHGLKKRERLLGWLYVGTIPERYRERLAASRKQNPDPAAFVANLPG